MAGRNKSPITLHERDGQIAVFEGGYSERFTLTSTEARFLARKLNRLALRIEKRQQEQA